MEIPEIITLKKDGITDFAAERNRLLAKARKEWVLFLDSDERVIGGQWPVAGNFVAYCLRRKNYFLGKYVGSEWLVRLGRKSAGKWVRRVHETWDIKSHPAGVIRNLYIIHDTANNLKDYIGKINYYSGLHALANKEEGKRSNLFKIIFYPVGKFIVTLIKSKHVVFSIMQAFHSYLSWSKLYFLQS